MSSGMTVAERMRAVLAFQPVDRLPVIEWASWWKETLARWRGEGLPSGVDPSVYFELDRLRQCWFPLMDYSAIPAPAHHGAPRLRGMDEYQRYRAHLHHGGGPLAFPADWWRSSLAEQAEGSCAVWFTLTGFFWFARELLGIEPHLCAFYEEPELLHAINADLVDGHLRLIEGIAALGPERPVFMTFAEDMSYNHGPMLSEAMFDEFMLPYYRKVIPALKELGVTVFIDSDGDVTVPIRWFLRAGIEGILPLERAAGVEVSALRAEHPKLRMLGAFDKMTMPKGEAAMRAEFERLLPVMRSGGFLPGVDHQTPPGVSIEMYRVFLRLFREYALLGARSGGFADSREGEHHGIHPIPSRLSVAFEKQ